MIFNGILLKENLKVDQKFISFLEPFVSQHKREFIDQVLAERTRHITIVMEDIKHPQNASAVLRTCECLGIQDIHIIENDNKFQIHKKIVKGSDKWLTIHRYRGKRKNNSIECIADLKMNGFLICGLHPALSGQNMFDFFPGDQKIALVFGNEFNGLSPEMQSHVDVSLRIPMVGFTESFNLSVCAAICVTHIRNTLIKKEVNFRLKSEEKERLKLDWYKKVIRKSGYYEREFYKNLMEGNRE